MKPVVYNQKAFAIAYDASLMDVPATEYFSVGFWQSRQAVTGSAVGRGRVSFVDTPVGSVVLRQYLRGGWVAKFNRKRYFFTSVERSRPIREFLLVAGMYERGLPVPRPVAALCEFRGFVSTGTILTARIPSARTLAELLQADNCHDVLTPQLFSQIGKCIHRFHAAGVWHADLNAHNILLDSKFRVFLIDFDRARFTPGRAIKGESNLKRLKRSLSKLWPAGKAPVMQLAWGQLKDGYHA